MDEQQTGAWEAHHLPKGGFKQGGVVRLQGVHGALHLGQQASSPLDASRHWGCTLCQGGVSLHSTLSWREPAHA